MPLIDLVPTGTGSHTASATSAAAVNATCPKGTRVVEVSADADFYWSRATGATAASNWAPAGGPYMISMYCPVTSGVFSVLSSSAAATKVHVTPLG